MNTARHAKRRLGRRKELAAALAVAAWSAIPADAAYQFIVSGYPAANESHPSASASTALVSATRRANGDATAIEARYRTREESGPTALRSDKFEGAFILIVR